MGGSDSLNAPFMVAFDSSLGPLRTCAVGVWRETLFAPKEEF